MMLFSVFCGIDKRLPVTAEAKNCRTQADKKIIT
jgi:hypothetical protein